MKVAGLALAGLWAALLSHELGHLAAGLAQGFRFSLFAAGPLWIGRRGERVAVAFNRSPLLWGGVAATLPTTREALRRRFAVVVAAGPAASLAVAIAGLAAVPHASGRVATFVSALAWSSFLLFLATAQPFGAGNGLASDGGRLASLLSAGRRGDVELAFLSVIAASTGGVRPRELPAAELELLLVSPPGPLMEGAAVSLAYRRALDAGRPEEARALLDRGAALLPRLSRAMQGDLRTELADRRARDGDPGGAREALAGLAGPFVERHRRLRAEASLARAEGRPDDARRLVAAARLALETPLFEATALDRDLVDELEAAVRSGAGPLSPPSRPGADGMRSPGP